MKRKTFNSVNTPSVRSTGVYLRIAPKSGGFTFSNDLAEMLNLEKNNINIVQDEEKPADWYIELTNDESAFKVRKKNLDKDKNFILQSTFLARTLLKECKLPEESTRFLVAAEPVEKNLYAILTKSAKK